MLDCLAILFVLFITISYEIFYVIDVSKKIALAWMVQKEKSVHCAGGILADDQVSFDALSSQQYFSCFTLFLESFLGSFKST